MVSLGILFTAISGVILTLPLSFPQLYFVSYLALIPVIYLLKEDSPFRGLLRGWFLGTIIFICSGYWLYFPLVNFSGLPWLICIIVLGLFVLTLGLSYGVWAWLYIFVRGKKQWISPFWLAVSWTGLEYLRFRIFTPFPFSFLGYTQVGALHFLQLADIGGLFLLTFITVLINGYVFKLLRRKKIAYLITLVLIFIMIFTYGNIRLDRLADNEGDLNIGLVSTEFDAGEKWKTENIEPIMDLLIKKTANLKDVDLVVWPESALTFDLIRNEYYRKRFFKGLNNIDKYIQVGSLAIMDNKNDIYNSSFLISPAGKVINRYNKIKLVPFGEYLPLERVVRALTGYTMISEKPGKEAVIFETPAGKWRTAICSEILDPALIKMSIEDADFIVNQSNEAWYPGSNLQQQMWTAATFRAVENRRSVVRAGNLAYSGIIGYTGKTLVSGEGVLEGEVELHNEETFYQQYGDFMGYISLGLTGLLLIVKLILLLVRKRKRE